GAIYCANSCATSAPRGCQVLENCGKCGKPWSQHTTGGCPLGEPEGRDAPPPLDIDEIERRAREQLSFHPDRSDANCQRCAAQEELLALVAEIRRLRGSSQAGSAPACPKCRVVGGGWDERTGTCASCGFIRVELKVSRERLREQIAADPDDVSVEAGAGSAGSPACAWCQGLLARATADGEEPSQEAMEHFELAGHFAGCPYLRVPEPFISKEGLGGNRQECTPRHDAPGFSEVNLARCVSPDG